MPARRNMQTGGEEKTIAGGRRNAATQKWECTAENISCSCNVCKDEIKAHCRHSYKNKGDLQDHISGHHGAGTGLLCTYGCGDQVFQNKSNLRRHERVCPAGPKTAGLQCPLCTSVHARSDNFKRHLIKTHQMAADEVARVVETARTGQEDLTAATAAVAPETQNFAFLGEVNDALPELAPVDPSLWHAIDNSWLNTIHVPEVPPNVVNGFDNAVSMPAYAEASGAPDHSKLPQAIRRDAYLTPPWDVSEFFVWGPPAGKGHVDGHSINESSTLEAAQSTRDSQSLDMTTMTEDELALFFSA